MQGAAMNIAGVVTYKRRSGGVLEGLWTHPDLRGVVANERAWDGPSDKLAGVYSVEINAPDNQRSFVGSLSIDEIGAAYRLVWMGTQLLPEPHLARYYGVGISENSDTLVATFQEDDAARGFVTWRELWNKIPGPDGERYADAFSHGTLRILLYAPQKVGPQTSHDKDEVYIVMKGSGTFVLAGTRRRFAEGDVLFVPAECPHWFEGFTDDLAVWAIFYGPLGGEAVGDVASQIQQANTVFSELFAAGDAAALAGMYTETAKLLPPGSPIVKGRIEIKNFWQDVIRSGIKDVTLKTAELQAFGDTAVESGSATLFGSGGVVQDVGKYLVVWKRVEAKWRLHRDCWNSNGTTNGTSGP